jgi:MFS family permease
VSEAAAAPAAALSRSSPFVALRHRNFRLLWSGQVISHSGSMMQTAAILWHVSLLVPPDRRALALGLVGLVRVGPILVFSMIAGVVADVFDRRRLMMATQASSAVIALVLAALTFRGLTDVWPIYVLAALSSAATSFDAPARQSLIPNLVPREHLANAISLNTIMIQIASVAGPSCGGLIIATGGVAWVYVADALSFGFVISALVLMRGASSGRAKRGAITLRTMTEGLRFVFSAPLIRSTMLLDFFATFFSSATALLPIFAQDILDVGVGGYGWLYAAPAIGAVVTSAAMVHFVERIERRGVVLLWAIGAYGLATTVFGLSRAFWLTFLCLALTGAADTVSMVLRNIVRYMETPDALRGRMVGVNMVFFMGGPQLGELEAGLVANWIGAPLSVVTGGLACVAATVILAAWTPALRAYRRHSTY